MKTSIYPSLPLRSHLAALTAGLLLAGVPAVQAQVWQNPYAPGSTADQQIRFNNGSAGAVTSPEITFATVLTYSSTPATGSFGGWGLTSAGSAAIGLGSVITGQTRTQTAIGSQTLGFHMTTTGLSNLVGLNLTSSWNANSGSIAGSDSWSAPTDDYRYTFDVTVSNAILSLTPTLFNSFNLTIRAGTTDIFSGSLSSILPSIFPGTMSGAAYFTYDQSDGPLSFIWSGSTLVNTSLLGLLGDGTDPIFTINNTSLQVDAIPEPGTYALLLGGAGLLALFRKRRKSLPSMA